MASGDQIQFGRIPTPGTTRTARRRYSFEKGIELTPPKPRKRPWRAPAIELDQGDTPECTVFAKGSFLQVAPLMTKRLPLLHPYYVRARELDDIPGVDYEGTTCHGAAAAFAERGWFKTFLWTNDPEAMREWILTRGTVVVGTDWHADMMETDSHGFIHATGPVVGGHAYNVVWYAERGDYYDIRQSWGPTWGVRGHAKIHAQELHDLISGARAGEVFTGVQELLEIPA